VIVAVAYLAFGALASLYAYVALAGRIR